MYMYLYMNLYLNLYLYMNLYLNLYLYMNLNMNMYMYLYMIMYLYISALARRSPPATQKPRLKKNYQTLKKTLDNSADFIYI